ncbi:MAG: acetate kinase [Clostridia bacterium]|nr:acetate kinase [Clostridia bacterium]
MKILVVNAGSSSLKYQLIDMDGEKMIAKGLVERIGTGKPGHQKQVVGKEVYEVEGVMIDTHVQATEMMLKALLDEEKGAIRSMNEIGAVGHRVLHGGTKFSASVIVNQAVKDAIRECIPLGPLHNPANLMGIEACEKVMPTTPQVAVFDTAFHQTMPPKAYMYGVPKKFLTKYGVRKYGFHGTSHRYVSKRVCEFLGISQLGTKMIICHLGNGSSLSAVVDGKCVDTTMGLTPLDGLLMGTRCGTCDPAVVQFIANNENMTVDEVLNMMNKESGLLGISGLSNDMRDVDNAADNYHGDAMLARDMLVYGIQKYIGSFVAAMGGCDMIVFTAGIGENNGALRERILTGMEWMGAKLDHARNMACADGHATECVISTDDSKMKLLVIPTNEEIMIARDTLELVKH